MGQGRRHFTDEFKQEAIALLVSSGRPLSQIASELGISPSMLRNWRNGSGGRGGGAARDPRPAAGPPPPPAPPRGAPPPRRPDGPPASGGGPFIKTLAPLP